MKKRTICWKDIGEFIELKGELTKRERRSPEDESMTQLQILIPESPVSGQIPRTESHWLSLGRVLTAEAWGLTCRILQKWERETVPVKEEMPVSQTKGDM